MIAFLILLDLMGLAVLSIVGLLGIRKESETWSSFSLGGHLAFLAGAILFTFTFITNIPVFFFLVPIDLIGFALCGGNICRAFGFPYIFTIPLSLSIYGALAGFLYAKYKTRSTNRASHVLPISPLRKAAIRILIPLNALVLLLPFAALSIPPTVQSYKETAILRSIIEENSNESRCVEFSFYGDLCYALAAIKNHRETPCENIKGLFPAFTDRTRLMCKNLVQQANDNLLARDSCERYGVEMGWQLECYFWLGVYLQDVELCSRDPSAPCHVYIWGK